MAAPDHRGDHEDQRLRLGEWFEDQWPDRNADFWIWSATTKGSSKALYRDFENGQSSFDYRDNLLNIRALCVRVQE